MNVLGNFPVNCCSFYNKYQNANTAQIHGLFHLEKKFTQCIKHLVMAYRYTVLKQMINTV